MTWAAAAPALGAALVVLLAPGVLVVAAAGVRGILAAALVPVTSVAVVAVSAVVAQLVGMPFGPVPVIAATVAGVAVVGAARWVGRRWEPAPPAATDGDRGRERRTLGAGLLGAALGGAALAVGTARGMGAADRWPQTFDAVFHLSAVDHVLRSGDGSALTLGAIATPERTYGFYPAAWHDLVALVASASGVPVPVAANAVALSAVAVAWPLGCAALTRVAVGPRPGPVAAAGVLAAGVAASPVMLTSYGTLWPNALATALLPAVLALGADLLGFGRPRASPVAAGTVVWAGSMAGLALAHPNSVVSVLVLGVPAVLVGTWGRGSRWRVGSVAAGVAVAWLVLLSPAFDAQRTVSWPARQRLPQAAGEWLALAPERAPVPFLVALLAVVGCVVAWRRPGLRWLLAVHATGGALFVLVAGSDGRISRLVSGAWWDDSFRLAALVGVAGVPLAAVGLDAVARRLALVVPRAGGVAGNVAVTTALIAGVVVATGGLHVRDTTEVVHRWYGPDDMLGPAERALLTQLPELVPAGERVAGSPWDGAALSGPIGDREAVFPHLSGTWGADRDLVARSLDDAASRPEVCSALDRLRVSHVLVGKATFWVGDDRRKHFAGMEVAGRDGFEEVARSGEMSLWRVTACAR